MRVWYAFILKIEDELHANDKDADKDGKEAPKKQSYVGCD